MDSASFPEHLDWSTVRLLTIEMDCIHLLTDAGETSFQFESEEELKAVLRAWTGENTTSETAGILARLKRSPNRDNRLRPR
jgi:hypothetical protein